jgi:hypothetical protein
VRLYGKLASRYKTVWRVAVQRAVICLGDDQPKESPEAVFDFLAKVPPRDVGNSAQDLFN